MGEVYLAEDLAITGKEFRVSDIAVAYAVNDGQAAFSASKNGVLIYRTQAEQIQSQFGWFDRTGKQLGIPGEPGIHFPDFDLSPDGKKIVMSLVDRASTSWDIWLMDFERSLRTRIIDDPGVESFPRWSPDGQRFLLLKPVREAMPIPITVILNWNSLIEQ